MQNSKWIILETLFFTIAHTFFSHTKLNVQQAFLNKSLFCSSILSVSKGLLFLWKQCFPFTLALINITWILCFHIKSNQIVFFALSKIVKSARNSFGNFAFNRNSQSYWFNWAYLYVCLFTIFAISTSNWRCTENRWKLSCIKCNRTTIRTYSYNFDMHITQKIHLLHINFLLLVFFGRIFFLLNLFFFSYSTNQPTS